MTRILPMVLVLSACVAPQQGNYDTLLSQANGIRDTIAEMAPAISSGCELAPGPVCDTARDAYKGAAAAIKLLRLAMESGIVGGEQMTRALGKAALALESVQLAVDELGAAVGTPD